MSDLTEFLLARIAEDETVARMASREVPQTRDRGEVWGVWIGNKWFQSTAYASHVHRHDPARVLAECEAKRRLVKSPYNFDSVLEYLALPHAGHPDYRQEWQIGA